MTRRLVPLLGALLLAAPAAFAASGQDVLKSQCVACHAIVKTDTTAEAMLDRKAPPLYYAGVKFNKPWLTAWLQNPTVIRPGGAMYSRIAKASADGTADTLDAAQIPAHMKLSADDASAVADALMELGTKDNVVQKGSFKGDPVNSMASLLFNKLRGCSSCHAIKGSGGLSGPDLTAAGDRLQPDFVVEYIRDPQKFDPHIWMPKLDLTDADVQKLTGYLMNQKQGAQK
jgi:mono/diheme cytochrome c family protein